METVVGGLRGRISHFSYCSFNKKVALEILEEKVRLEFGISYLYPWTEKQKSPKPNQNQNKTSRVLLFVFFEIPLLFSAHDLPSK